MQELTNEVNGLRTELERSQDCATEARQAAEEAAMKMSEIGTESERWRREREEGRERVERLEGELQQCMRTLEQGRNREQRMAKEIQTVRLCVCGLFSSRFFWYILAFCKWFNSEAARYTVYSGKMWSILACCQLWSGHNE